MNEEQKNTANSWGQERVEKYIKKSDIKGCVGYRVFIHRHDLQVNERFETLEKAQAFRDEALRLCEIKRIQNVRDQLQIKEYPYNLIYALDLEVDDVILTFDERINELLNKGILSPRTYAYLMGIYKAELTYNELAKRESVTTERVRQIVAKGIRKLNAHRRFLMLGEFAYSESKAAKDYKAYIAEHKLEWDYDSAKAFIGEYRDDKNFVGSIYNTSIDELDFSIRTSNCLKRANIQNLGELCERTEEDMMKVRNLGKKSLKEIREKLLSMDLSLREYE